MTEFIPGPNPNAPPTLSGVRRHWLPGATVGMIFLAFPAVDVVRADLRWWIKMAALGAIVLIGAAYLLLTPAAMFWTRQGQIILLALLLAISAGLWPAAGSDLVALWMFVGIMAGALLPMRATAAVAFGLAAGMWLLAQLDGQPVNWELAGALIGLSLWMCAFMDNIRISRELRNTRQELATAAVAAERERIGRDLHDILGHSLTAIAVKAGLARRLIQQGAPGVLDEIGDVEQLAREALADVRSTASGYREVSLGSEIALAAMVLRAAGISATLPTAVDAVDPRARELFGYVVREAVTNVVRHSGAQHCRITVGADVVQILDDGSGSSSAGREGFPKALGAGSGLAGLAERVHRSGGTFTAGPATGGGFSVEAALPPVAAASKVPARLAVPQVALAQVESASS